MDTSLALALPQVARLHHFTVEFSATSYRTVTVIHGTTHNLRTDID